MSSTPRRSRKSDPAAMRAEYAFDYTRAKPNRFAPHMDGGNVVAVVLDPDVASVFRSSAKVNALLHSVISALPDRKTAVRGRAPRRKAG